MGKDRKDLQGKIEEETLQIKPKLEIKVGQQVPILEHAGCPSSFGIITSFDPETRYYQIKCKTCGNNGVIIDLRELS